MQTAYKSPIERQTRPEGSHHSNALRGQANRAEWVKLMGPDPNYMLVSRRHTLHISPVEIKNTGLSGVRLARWYRIRFVATGIRRLIVFAFAISLAASFQAQSQTFFEAMGSYSGSQISLVSNCHVSAAGTQTDLDCHQQELNCKQTVCQFQIMRVNETNTIATVLPTKVVLPGAEVQLTGISDARLFKPPRFIVSG